MIKPLLNRVVLKEVENKTETASGILLPKAKLEKQNIALIEAIGSEVVDELNVGDSVIFDRYKGTTIKIDEESYIIIEDKHILAKLD